ncbi:hypothetical protein BD65_1830 [Yersinia ruckeri]|nr:hypothetical protein BD65_1830 [Yersinia ruckeri]
MRNNHMDSVFLIQKNDEMNAMHFLKKYIQLLAAELLDGKKSKL